MDGLAVQPVNISTPCMGYKREKANGNFLPKMNNPMVGKNTA
jgi:hypothetical protein